MKQAIGVILGVMALAATSARGADNQATNLDDSILALALAGPSTNGSYVAVYSKAGLDCVDISQAQAIKRSLSGRGADAVIGSLVDQLFARNKSSATRQAVRLTLTSSLTNGYVVDHDEKYVRYFQNDGGGWPRLYEENPKCRGMITVSLPAYDKKTGLVMLYKGVHEHGLQSFGEVILYRHESGKLKKLSTLPLWRA